MSSKILTSDDYFNLANNYLAAYSKASEELQNVGTSLTSEELSELYRNSKPLMRIAYEFQKLGFANISTELNSSAEKLKDAIQDATDTIRNIQMVGKVIEIITDLVAIGVIIAVPAPKPTSLTIIPALVKELIGDVKSLKDV